MSAREAPTFNPPGLASLPPEILHLILQWLPAEDAYFARFLCRSVRPAAAERVEKAVAEMIAEKDPNSFVDFYRNTLSDSEFRTDGDVERSAESTAGLFRRVGLQPGLVCYEMLVPLDHCERGTVLKHLNASKADVRLALEYFAAVDSEAQGNYHHACLLEAGLTYREAFEVVQSLRRTSFTNRWIMVVSLKSNLWNPKKYEGRSRAEVLLTDFCDDLRRNANKFDEDGEIYEALAPIMRWFDTDELRDVLKHLDVSWYVRGKIWSQIVREELGNEIPDEVWRRVTREVFDVFDDETTQKDFMDFLHAAQHVVRWWYFVPLFLDEDLWPRDRKLQIWDFLKAVCIMFSYESRKDEMVPGAGNAILAIVDYENRIEPDRIRLCLEKTREPVPWDAACAQIVDSLEGSHKGDRMRWNRITAVFQTPEIPIKCLTKMIFSVLGDPDPLPEDFAEQWLVWHVRLPSGGFYASKVADFVKSVITSTSRLAMWLRFERGRGLDASQVDKAHLLLVALLGAVRPKYDETEYPVWIAGIQVEPRTWNDFVGEIVCDIYDALERHKGRHAWRHMGRVLGSGCGRTEVGIGGETLWKIRKLVESFRKDDDVVQFVSGFLEIEPGQHVAAILEGHRTDLDKAETIEARANLLKTLIQLGDNFGEVRLP